MTKMQLFCYYFCIKNQPKIETKISMKCQLLEPGACENPGIEEFGEIFVRGELPFVIGKMGFPGRHYLRTRLLPQVLDVEASFWISVVVKTVVAKSLMLKQFLV